MFSKGLQGTHLFDGLQHDCVMQMSHPESRSKEYDSSLAVQWMLDTSGSSWLRPALAFLHLSNITEPDLYLHLRAFHHVSWTP